jgi:hypothetical protein
MIFAYADPPYIGCANLYPEKTEVDHELLIKQLMDYDGWALSTHSPGLKALLPMCPDDIRIGAWVKPWAAFRPNVNPAYAWEPVIFWGGRRRGRELPTLRDWVSANATRQRGVVGAKPKQFCYWAFGMLGANSNDTLIDLYPGSGAVSEAWEEWGLSFLDIL